MDLVYNKLMNEIIASTTRIQNEFPELYRFLNETPLFLTYKKSEISLIDFRQYLDSLNEQISAAEKSRGISNNGKNAT